MSSSKQRIADLEAFAAEEGLALPLPAATIAAMEATGAVVDLATGAVIPGAAGVRYRLTTLGEANAVVWKKERSDGR